MYLDDLLNKKWKIDTNDNQGILYCHMPEIDDEVYLHRLYKKCNLSDEFYRDLEKKSGIIIIPELRDFYKNYNGCRLFHSSINIFGFDVGASSPMSLILGNVNKQTELEINGKKGDDIVYIGSAGEYLVFYKKSELQSPKIYLSNHGDDKIIKEFSSIKELLTYYISACLVEYNEKGYRNHPLKNPVYKKYPVLKNSFEKIDWDLPTEEQGPSSGK